MVYNAVSAKSVIGKVYRDLNIEDPSFELDAIEWIGEALEWIGAGIASIDKEEWVIATNHTATLPSDIEVLKGVWVVDQAPLKENWRDEDFPYDLSQVSEQQKYKLERTDEQLYDGIGGSSTDLQYNGNFDSRGDLDTGFQELQGSQSQDPVQESNSVGHNYKETYHLNGNQIKTSFNSGLLLLAYKGLPLDENGYPLVPDDVAYREALFWYIVKKLALGGQNLIVEYQTAEQRWLKRCTQARNRAKFPDLDEYEKFLQSWTQMVNTRRFNKGNIANVGDKRGDLIESGQYTPRPSGNYRVTEDGVTRITEDGETRFTEDN